MRGAKLNLVFVFRWVFSSGLTSARRTSHSWPTPWSPLPLPMVRNTTVATTTIGRRPHTDHATTSFAHEGPTPSAEVAWSSRPLLHTPRLADQESRLSSTSFFTEDEGLLHIDYPSAFSRSPNHRERARPCFLKLGKKSTIGYTGPREADITSSLLLSVISAKDHTYVASLWVGQVPQPVR